MEQLIRSNAQTEQGNGPSQTVFFQQFKKGRVVFYGPRDLPHSDTGQKEPEHGVLQQCFHGAKVLPSGPIKRALTPFV